MRFSSLSLPSVIHFLILHKRSESLYDKSSSQKYVLAIFFKITKIWKEWRKNINDTFTQSDNAQPLKMMHTQRM
jgi:hypothetical protein